MKPQIYVSKYEPLYVVNQSNILLGRIRLVHYSSETTYLLDSSLALLITQTLVDILNFQTVSLFHTVFY